jgi:hypothetical protein
MTPPDWSSVSFLNKANKQIKTMKKRNIKVKIEDHRFIIYVNDARFCEITELMYGYQCYNREKLDSLSTEELELIWDKVERRQRIDK